MRFRCKWCRQIVLPFLFTSTLSPGPISDSLAFLFLSAYTFAFAFFPLSLSRTSLGITSTIRLGSPLLWYAGSTYMRPGTCELHPSNLFLRLAQFSSFSIKIYFAARPPIRLGPYRSGLPVFYTMIFQVSLKHIRTEVWSIVASH